MRGADDEPERAAARGRAGHRLLIPLVVLGAAVVVLSAAAEGRAHVTPFGSGTAEQGGISPGPIPTGAAPATAAADPAPPAVGAAVQTVLTVLACAAALAVAVALIRLIVAAVRSRRRRGGPRRFALDGDGIEPAVADAPTVLRGIAAALQAFEERREPGDAVVRAWLGLQQAAEDAGFARAAAETPTEFTGRVLSRTGADRAALRTLLRLYLRARFGDGVITDADATAARDALEALQASWRRTPAASDATARG